MIIDNQSKLKNADGTDYKFTHGQKLSDFYGKDIHDRRAGGYEFYLYQLPKGYDSAVHKLNGNITPIPDTPYCTHNFVDLTEVEKDGLAAKAVSDAISSVVARRRSRYQHEADPLFFEFQRGEVTQQVWLDKIAEIRADIPDVIA